VSRPILGILAARYETGGVMKTTLLVVSILVVALALPAMAAAQAGDRHPTMKVGTVTVARGQKASGTLDVPAGSDAATRIPVVVVHGVRPGPVLALVAGAHGTEYSSIVALERLIDQLEPAQISGTVIIVPLVNLASFEQRVAHVNPVDGKSMNRFYPGNMTGTQTERASAVITKEVVEQCDHLMDLHGGDTDESLRPYSYWTVTGNAAVDRVSHEMALAFGLDHIIISADRPKDPNASRYLENTATTRGKPSLTAEAGHAGTVETDDVNALVYGCVNVMRYLKMTAGEAKLVEHPVWIDGVQAVTSEVGGMFYPLVKRGTYAAQGMVIGYVTDYVGKKILDVRAPVAGVVLFIRAVPSLVKDDTLVSMGVVGSDEKYLTQR
jgi:predicted deacylase